MTSETLAERRAYLEEGLSDIGCARCGALVRAGKRSPQQTSVQWTVRAASACAALAAAHAAGRPAALVPTCPDLRDTIDRAVREGRLEVS
ncbi:hypothetical protein [Couchioplanes caeruleus]|uniref:Ferredoxin n=2 Tax=Couchioplanes caeruleus TaxID=56438 RepID=A0A1K0FIN5_9ACTN|nr:hypothetical protein [Couchioplanes caeruleus]OJF12689.1 hypothetical protein BG844_19235 [Couchioplanes caeruleus subsp. caeruleus]ROP28061.1 hypothetical protein EDD30_0768 [Couchioplanes caeruleus]